MYISLWRGVLSMKGFHNIKKALGITLLFLLSFLLISSSLCESVYTPVPTDEPTNTPAPADLLPEDGSIDYDQLLIDAIIKISTADFYEPAAVRVLEIVEFTTHYALFKSYEEIKESPWNVVVRLQGENKIGGTINHYYMICIKDGYVSSRADVVELQIQNIEITNKLSRQPSLYELETLQAMKANVGDYIELGDNYQVSSKQNYDMAQSHFTIKNVNKGLIEYWEDLGF